MKASIKSKLESLHDRFDEIAALLSQPEIQSDQNQFRALSQEYSQINPLVDCYNSYIETEKSISSAQEMLTEDDHEIREMAQEEIAETKALQEKLDDELQILLLPRDPNDDRNIYLEIRAGTGGDEAALFSGDLARMYTRYAESQHWKIGTTSETRSEHGGFREIILRITGIDVYSKLKFESGVHRVQRVPETESQGRVHTSACTVAIMPEAAEIDNIEINPSDLRIDTFRASGAGGQHVNKTDSAIRITHLPTGLVVECQDGRSQHKNKAQALSVLQSRLLSTQQEKQHAENSENRKSQVGSGDRSERIRTYNYPQGRVTDHRINLTLYKLDEIMQGGLNYIINPLINEHQAEQLTQLGEES
jgi:peptide chain release factor 1